MSDIQTLLDRGVDAIYPSRRDLEAKLKEGKPLRVYWGVDPTGELQLHHIVPMFKLREFQDLGHKVYILIGSFTAMIGDPTGKTKTRVPLTKDQVVQNAQNYVQYMKKVMDFEHNPPEIVYNGDWLEKLSFKDVVELSSHFTVQQMIERDMFQERLNASLPIGLHEFMYPLMQGYDSVALEVDVEIGGSDQTFNMLAGRKLLEQYKNKEKFVVATPLLVDISGKKMSTSDGSGVPLNLSADDMYGKIMSLPDAFLENLFLLCALRSKEEVDAISLKIKNGENPLEFKKQLAFEITERFHGKDDAERGQAHFESVVQNDELPEDIPEWKVEAGLSEITDLVYMVGLVDSKSDAKRMVKQGAVSIIDGENEKKIDEPNTFVELKDNLIVRVGKRRYIRLKF